MGIKSTRYLTRETAITRIKHIHQLAEHREYRELQSYTNEHDYHVREFVNNYDTDISEIEKWTDDMIADLLDEPFFRYSMFDNYLIGEADGCNFW